MDNFEQSNLEKETDDFDNTFHQNAIHCKEKENTFLKKLQMWYILSCLCYTLGGRMTEIFSVELQET